MKLNLKETGWGHKGPIAFCSLILDAGLRLVEPTPRRDARYWIKQKNNRPL